MHTSQIQKFWNDQAEWSQATFGSDEERGPLGPLMHLAKEALECQNEPYNITEKADCLFLIFDATRRSRYTLTDLLAAALDCHSPMPQGLRVQDYLSALYRSALRATLMPHDLKEKAYALTILLAANRACLQDLDTLLDACFAKLEVNRKREWQKPTSNAPVEHVRA